MHNSLSARDGKLLGSLRLRRGACRRLAADPSLPAPPSVGTLLPSMPPHALSPRGANVKLSSFALAPAEGADVWLHCGRGGNALPLSLRLQQAHAAGQSTGQLHLAGTVGCLQQLSAELMRLGVSGSPPLHDLRHLCDGRRRGRRRVRRIAAGVVLRLDAFLTEDGFDKRRTRRSPPRPRRAAGACARAHAGAKRRVALASARRTAAEAVAATHAARQGRRGRASTARGGGRPRRPAQSRRRRATASTVTQPWRRRRRRSRRRCTTRRPGRRSGFCSSSINAAPAGWPASAAAPAAAAGASRSPTSCSPSAWRSSCPTCGASIRRQMLLPLPGRRPSTASSSRARATPRCRQGRSEPPPPRTNGQARRGRRRPYGRRRRRRRGVPPRAACPRRRADVGTTRARCGRCGARRAARLDPRRGGGPVGGGDGGGAARTRHPRRRRRRRRRGGRRAHLGTRRGGGAAARRAVGGSAGVECRRRGGRLSLQAARRRLEAGGGVVAAAAKLPPPPPSDAVSSVEGGFVSALDEQVIRPTLAETSPLIGLLSSHVAGARSAAW